MNELFCFFHILISFSPVCAFFSRGVFREQNCATGLVESDRHGKVHKKSPIILGLFCKRALNNWDSSIKKGDKLKVTATERALLYNKRALQY